MTPNDIQNKRFDKGMGGYKVDDVNAFLSEVADYVARLQSEKDEIEKKMVVLAEKVEEYREDEQSLRAALIGAQKLGDSVVREAKKKAEMIMAEANSKAQELVQDARTSIDRETISFAKLQGEVTNFKNQVLDMYRKQIELIENNTLETKTPPTVLKAIRTFPPKAEPEPVQPESDKADEFVLTYEEDGDDAPAAEVPVPPAKHKRGSYGNLRFGEEYNLTRKE